MISQNQNHIFPQTTYFTIILYSLFTPITCSRHLCLSSTPLYPRQVSLPSPKVIGSTLRKRPSDGVILVVSVNGRLLLRLWSQFWWLSMRLYAVGIHW